MGPISSILWRPWGGDINHTELYEYIFDILQSRLSRVGSWGVSMRKLLVVGLAGAAAIGSFLLIEGRPQANACRGNYWNLGDAHAAGERHQNAVVTFERNTPGMAGKDN